MNKVEYLTMIIEDAERRIGSYIVMGGKQEDLYILKQVKIILEAYQNMDEAIEQENTNTR